MVRRLNRDKDNSPVKDSYDVVEKVTHGSITKKSKNGIEYAVNVSDRGR